MDDTVRRALRPAPVGGQLPRLTIVLETGAQKTAQPVVQGRILDRSDRLHASVEIALHPVCRANIELLGAAISKVEQARMLKESPDDADDADVVAHPRNAWAQAADAAHDELDVDTGARGAIQRFDRFRIDERVHLRDDARSSAGARVLGFAIDQIEETRPH